MDNKINERKHTRKYLGVLFEINGYDYFAPLSSPKSYDVNADGSFKKSNLFCSRIVMNDGGGKMHMYGKIMYKNMIPVPKCAIIDYKIADETDSKYKDVVINEYRWIQLHKGEIIYASNRIYRFKCDSRNQNDGRINAIVNFKDAEKICLLYSQFVKEVK